MTLGEIQSIQVGSVLWDFRYDATVVVIGVRSYSFTGFWTMGATRNSGPQWGVHEFGFSGFNSFLKDFKLVLL